MMAPSLDLTLRADRIGYLTDLAFAHLGWTGRFLHYEEPSAALASHARFAKVVEAIDREMAGIQTAVQQAEAIGSDLVEWRRDRDRARPSNRGEGKSLTSIHERVRQAGAPSREQVAGLANCLSGETA